MVNYLRKECTGCRHWLAGEFCGRVQFGMPCVLGGFPGADIPPPEGVFVSHLYAPREPAAVTGRAKPEDNRLTATQMFDEAIACAENGQKRMAAYERQMHAKPEENRFLLWSHENLANFAKDVLAQNSQLRERLAQIRELAK